MIRVVWLTLSMVWLNSITVYCQKPVYHPCFLMDSVDKHLDFIKRNAQKVFVDSFDCRQTLMDSITSKYLSTKNKKYLDALQGIRVYGNDKVEDLYTDIIKRLCEKDFASFIQELYVSKGTLYALEKELITTMNMIIDGRPYKQKYIGQLNLAISKAKDSKDTYKAGYLEKLKQKIEEERY